MSIWPDADKRTIERYLGQRRFRDPGSRTRYRHILLGFQERMPRQEHPTSHLSRDDLRVWLREGAACWAASTVMHRALIVDRFLDFLATEGLIASNPVADLSAEYHVKSHRAILWALLADDPDQALEALRELPPFGSVLGDLMRDHIALMRSRGFRYQAQARWLLRFDHFLQVHPELSEEPLAVMLRHWSAARSTPNQRAECEKLARILNKALRHEDPGIELRRPDPEPMRQVARHYRQPYIFSLEEIRRLLDIARGYPSPRAPLRPLSLYTMLVLAYCAGLRVGELSRLNLSDVDLQSGTITIRETKFFKSRILPLSGSALKALCDYMNARRGAQASQDPESALFWHEKGRDRYTNQGITSPLVDILRRAGIKPPQGKIGPRIHDLRHTFVVHRILDWYRAGINPQDRLPYLATYLGHRDINSTLVYITVTQELLQQAGERFGAIGAPCLNTTEGRLS
ncbi:MAG: tyrosine-type recombinase/integrase [Anaerolineales bacterium]